MENQFRQYPLEEDILGALDALGYTQPTEIQAAVIPSILNGRDIIAKSMTGSGKRQHLRFRSAILPIGSRILRRHLY